MLPIFKFFIDYIFPPTCLSCSKFTAESYSFCAECWNKFNFISEPYCKTCGIQFEFTILEQLNCAKCIQIPPSYDFARSLFKFDENSKKIIHLFKYQDRVELAKLFAKLFYKFYYHEIKTADYIIPVPMNRFKRIFRMYNQADLLCIELAKCLNIPRIPDALIKTKWTKSQVYLKRKERKRSLNNTIAFNFKYSLKDKNILLIDDVITTGFTLEHCSKILKTAGAKNIIVLTIAMR